jgi:hypothetical protein
MLNQDYDKESDVMYISFGVPLPCHTIEFDHDEYPSFCLRFDPETKKLNGITIVDYTAKTTDSKIPRSAENKMFEITIKADTNDGDYVTSINQISEEDLNKIRPLIKAIKEFEPYPSKIAPWVCDHNYPHGQILYDDSRHTPPRKHYKFDSEIFDIFEDLLPYNEYGFHSIVSISVCPYVEKEILV